MDENLNQSDTSVIVEEILGDTSAETEVLAEVVEPDRLFLTTPFDDYTVTEGLLLMILLLSVVLLCVKMIKGGFFWL